MQEKFLQQLKQVPVAAGVLISRFGMLPYNFSPLGSFGFFSGNIWQFFATIVIFDYLKGGSYTGQLFTYVGFLAYWVLGKAAKNNQKKQLLYLPIASFLFFIISNLGVWWFWYPQTAAGLLACYIAALPFYRNTLLGDLVFGYGLVAVRVLLKKYQLHQLLHREQYLPRNLVK